MELVNSTISVFDCFLKEYRDRLRAVEPDSPVKVPDVKVIT